MVETFGTYRLHEKVAQGGMAEVFVATDRDRKPPNDRVAIKRMFSHLVEQQELKNMFIDEARIASRLDHPNIVEIYDLGTVDETFYIAMEYVEGLDLRRACEKGVAENQFVSRPLAAYIIAEVAAGLDYAHDRTDDQGEPMNIIHRDVSPQNVLLSLDGEVKLCDFGIAKAESRLTETRFGELKGKFSYMSPEQFGQGDLDHRSDIFTLGILLYETTAVTRLFRADNEYEAMRMVTDGDFAPPGAVRDDYPEALEEIVMRALAVDPDERYQSAGALRRDLLDWISRGAGRVGQPELADYVRELMDEPGPALDETGEITVDVFPERTDQGVDEATTDMTVSDRAIDRAEQQARGRDDETTDITVGEDRLDEMAAPASEGEKGSAGAVGGQGDATVDQAIPEEALPDTSGDEPAGESGDGSTIRPSGPDQAGAEADGGDEFGEPKTKVSRPEPGLSEGSVGGGGPGEEDDEFEAPSTLVTDSEAAARDSAAGEGPADDEFGEPKTQLTGATSGPDGGVTDRRADSGKGGEEDDFETMKTNVVGGGPDAATTEQEPDQGAGPPQEEQEDDFEAMKTAVAGPGDSASALTTEQPGSDEPASPDVGAAEPQHEESPKTPQSGGGLEGNGARREPEQMVDEPRDESMPDPGAGTSGEDSEEGESLEEIPDLRGGGRELTGIEELPTGSPTRGEKDRDEGVILMPWGWSLPGEGANRWVPLAAVAGAVVMVLTGALVWLVVSDGEEPTDDGAEVVEAGPVAESTTVLELKTRPEGARVVANGVVVEGQTPLEVPLVRGVDNELSIVHEGRRPVRLLVSGEGSSMQRDVELDRMPVTEVAGVSFDSEPRGATVKVDGREIGETPVRIENVPAGIEHHVQFDKQGYRPSIAFVEFAPDEVGEIDARLEPEQTDRVQGRYRLRPEGAKVSLDAERLGETPFDQVHRAGDWLELETSADGRQTDHRRLRLDQIGGFELATELGEEVEATGMVTMEADSPAAVYIDGRTLGQLPLDRAEIPSGRRSLTFETAEGRRLESAVEIDADTEHRYRVELTDEEATLEILED